MMESEGSFSFAAKFDPDSFVGKFDLDPPGEEQEIAIEFPDGGSFRGVIQYISPGEGREVPDGRWQRFKERWCPRWLLRCFPVRMIWIVEYSVKLKEPLTEE